MDEAVVPINHVLDKWDLYAGATLEQLKNDISTKWHLTERDMICKIITHLKLYVHVV